MTKEELINKLEHLRNKWKGNYPKSNLDKRWWEFRCDKCLAIRIKKKLENFGENQILEEYKETPDINKVAEMIFGKSTY